MHHPNEIQLQRYLDGELDHEARDLVRAHLAVCPACSGRAETYAQVSATVRSSVPAPEAFASEGAFWARMAARLETRPASRWPLVPLLPPFLLAALGTMLQAALGIVVVLFALSALGVLPAPAAVVAGGIPAVLGHPWLEGTLYAWLGWSSAEVVQSATARWQELHVAAQHGILLGATVMGLVAALGVVAVLDLTWALCWPGAARRETEGGK